MNEQEFKKYVNETMANIFTKLDVNEKKFINHMVNRFNEICEENQELHKNIDKATEILKDNFVEDYVRSCDTADGVGRYEIDTEHWTYKVYEELKGSDVDGM